MLFKEFKKVLEIDKYVIIKLKGYTTKYTFLPKGYLLKEFKTITLEDALNKFGNRTVDYTKAEMIGADECCTVFYLNESNKQWLEFKPMLHSGTTKKFRVLGSDGSTLGVVRWHTGYRKYAFYVTGAIYRSNERHNGEDHWVSDTKIFDSGCMREIEYFMNQLMIDREVKAITKRNRINELYEELIIKDAESGADREVGYNPEVAMEKAIELYEKICS